MQPRVFGDLSVEVREDTGTVRLDFRGKSNLRQPELHLVPFFSEVTNRARSANAAVEMHFEALEFFNSSTITSIIQYVKDLREKKIRLTVVFNPHNKWQKIFFDALWIFDKGDGLFTVQSVRG